MTHIDVPAVSINCEQLERRFNRISSQICLLGAELVNFHNLISLQINMQINQAGLCQVRKDFCLVSKDKVQLLNVFDAYVMFGSSLQYNMHDFCTMNQITDLDAVLTNFENFELDKVLQRISKFVVSDEALSFLKAIRDTIRTIDNYYGPDATIIRNGDIIFAYLRGQLSLDNIPTTVEDVRMVAKALQACYDSATPDCGVDKYIASEKLEEVIATMRNENATPYKNLYEITLVSPSHFFDDTFPALDVSEVDYKCGAMTLMICGIRMFTDPPKNRSQLDKYQIGFGIYDELGYIKLITHVEGDYRIGRLMMIPISVIEGVKRMPHSYKNEIYAPEAKDQEKYDVTLERMFHVFTFSAENNNDGTNIMWKCIRHEVRRHCDDEVISTDQTVQIVVSGRYISQHPDLEFVCGKTYVIPKTSDGQIDWDEFIK